MTSYRFAGTTALLCFTEPVCRLQPSATGAALRPAGSFLAAGPQSPVMRVVDEVLQLPTPAPPDLTLSAVCVH
ncbi:hypothetical protein ACW73L_11590 [Methylolobus aquaticus]